MNNKTNERIVGWINELTNEWHIVKIPKNVFWSLTSTRPSLGCYHAFISRSFDLSFHRCPTTTPCWRWAKHWYRRGVSMATPGEMVRFGIWEAANYFSELHVNQTSISMHGKMQKSFHEKSLVSISNLATSVYAHVCLRANSAFPRDRVNFFGVMTEGKERTFRWIWLNRDMWMQCL